MPWEVWEKTGPEVPGSPPFLEVQKSRDIHAVDAVLRKPIDTRDPETQREKKPVKIWPFTPSGNESFTIIYSNYWLSVAFAVSVR